MGIGHSPRIVTDGLVFAMDGSNSHKSWKGKPTTNLITSPEISTTGWSLSGTNDGTTINTSWTVMADRTGPFLRGMSEVIADRSNTWPFIRSPQFTTGSGTFTWSGEYRMQSMSSITSIAGFRASAVANDYGTSGLQTHNLSYTEAGEGWKSFSLTRTLNSGTTYSLGGNPQTYRPSWEWYSGGMNTTGERWVVDFRKLQVEENSFATPFVDGTRSNTQAIKDLTGQNTVTVQSMTYNSDGTFEFDGSSDNFIIPTIDFSTAQTVEIWMKPTESDGSRRNPYNQAYGGFGTWTHEPNGDINAYFGTAGGNAQPYVNRNSGSDGKVLQNETACMCFTRDTSTTAWYKNGIQVATGSNPYGTLPATSANITIGDGYATAFKGSIFAVKLYDRALSAEEVKQNFNALRGRHGI